MDKICERSALIIAGFLTMAVILSSGTGHLYAQNRDISVSDAYELIQKKRGDKNFIILDVRTPREFHGGYIDGAININYFENDFKDRLEVLDKDKTYLVYCRSGRRSKKTQNIMERLGFKSVYNMAGGILQWNSDELPIKR